MAILLVVVGAMVIGLLAGLVRIGYGLPAARRRAGRPPRTHPGRRRPGHAHRARACRGHDGGDRAALDPAYLAPIAGAARAPLACSSSRATPLTQLLLALGAAGLLAVNLAMVRTHPTLDVGVMAIGAAFLLVADMAWLTGRPIPLARALVDGLPGADHRGRATRARAGPSAQPRRRGGRSASSSAATSGLRPLIAFDADLGIRLSGLAMLGLAAWLLRYDIAWLTIHRPGLPRFVAICLLAGYGWLVVGGLLGARQRHAVGRADLRRPPARDPARLRLQHDLRTRAHHLPGHPGSAHRLPPGRLRPARAAPGLGGGARSPATSRSTHSCGCWAGCWASSPSRSTRSRSWPWSSLPGVHPAVPGPAACACALLRRIRGMSPEMGTQSTDGRSIPPSRTNEKGV